MRIRKRKPVEPRTEPVKFGEESHGKRKLVQAVMQRGVSLRTSTKAVDAVIKKWKRALIAKDQHIEFPIGHLKAKKTPERLRRKRYVASRIGNRDLGRTITWTTYNDEYRILWRVPPKEWDKWLRELNPPPKIDAEISELLAAVYCVPNPEDRKRIEELARSKEVLLLCLQTMKRNGRHFDSWDKAWFWQHVADRCRSIRENMQHRTEPRTSVK